MQNVKLPFFFLIKERKKRGERDIDRRRGEEERDRHRETERERERGARQYQVADFQDG